MVRPVWTNTSGITETVALKKKKRNDSQRAWRLFYGDIISHQRMFLLDENQTDYNDCDTVMKILFSEEC